MTEPNPADQVPSKEPKPMKINVTTAVAFGAATFIAGGLACAATYGRILKLDNKMNYERWKAAWGIIDIHRDFLKDKDLVDEFYEAKGHLQLLQ